MSKVRAPYGMLEAVNDASDAAQNMADDTVIEILEAALTWLVEQEIGDPMLTNIVSDTTWCGYHHTVRSAIHAYLTRMFVTPEPKVPEEIKDLLHVDSSRGSSESWNRAVIEAYRRGQKAGKP